MPLVTPLRWCAAVALACAAVPIPLLAQSQPTALTSAPAPAPPEVPAAPALQQPPPLTPVRWNEDYSYLARANHASDYLDGLKYIPLGSDPDTYFSLGGQVRERYEYFNNSNFGAGPQDEDGYSLTRLLLNGDLHISPYFRLFAQGKSAMIDDREGGPRPIDADELDVQQLFADLRLPVTDSLTTTFRFGRQELIYGNERLIGPLDWTNTMRTFDGIKVMTEFKTDSFTNSLDLFLVRPLVVEKETFNNGDGDQTFWGAYDTLALPHLIDKANTQLELYLLGLDQQSDAARAVDADTYTAGTRFYTNPKPFDFETELDYQFGKHGAQDISAASVSTTLGFTAAGVETTPHPFVGFDYATGDGDPGDGKYSTFNQLFPTAHKFFGEIDTIGRQNILSPNIGADFTFLQNASFVKKLGGRVQYLGFWRANDSDGVYTATGAPLGRPSASHDNFVGSELDFILGWQIDRHFSLTASYSHFFAGSYISHSDGGNSSLAQDIDFAYMTAQFTF